jgi:hypothetical protein
VQPTPTSRGAQARHDTIFVRCGVGTMPNNQGICSSCAVMSASVRMPRRVPLATSRRDDRHSGAAPGRPQAQRIERSARRWCRPACRILRQPRTGRDRGHRRATPGPARQGTARGLRRPGRRRQTHAPPRAAQPAPARRHGRRAAPKPGGEREWPCFPASPAEPDATSESTSEASESTAGKVFGLPTGPGGISW